ncbi:hypothetical protein APHAL10511_001823 [Amanita phalloides]|nr:hypothetical protein APHAL10511_001823 [Amanita phalloides]
MTASIILYRYDASPFCKKIETTLLLRHIPHHRVNVAFTLPRPEISDVLGIAYRRVPVLSIGGDVYCDTSLIAVALERRYNPASQRPTVFPKAKISRHTDSGLVKASALLAESGIFRNAVGLVPWTELPALIVQDRSAFLGTPISPDLIATTKGRTLSFFASHLQLLEEQLEDGREWLFGTEQSGIVDISFYVFCSWIRHLPAADGLINSKEFPGIVNWLDRFSALIAVKESEQSQPTELTGDQAADAIMSSDLEPLDTIGFDEQEASRLGVHKDETVSIAPTDTGKDHATVGKLVALNSSELVIEVDCPKGMIQCHFPSINFSAKSVKSIKD